MAHWILFKCLSGDDTLFNFDKIILIKILDCTLCVELGGDYEEYINRGINPKITLTSLNKVLAQSKSYDTIDLTGDDPVIIGKEQLKWHLSNPYDEQYLGNITDEEKNYVILSSDDNEYEACFLEKSDASYSNEYGDYGVKCHEIKTVGTINEAMRVCQEHYERSLGNGLS